jgi:tetratricopeptide (TPR) repeat protein
MDLGQEEIIEYVKRAIDQIQDAKTKEDKDYHLFQLLAYLITSSNEIAQNGDYYEAGGRLYSAAYYLEEFYPKEAQDVYSKAVDFYSKYYKKKILDGATNEAANVAIRIANIYRDKVRNTEKEHEYVQNAINLIQNQIDLLSEIGSPRDVGVKYQSLSMLYVRLEKWEEVTKISRVALDYAKIIKDFSIIANAYNDMALAMERQGDAKKARNILFEAMDYFSKEAVEHEAQQDLLPLSQLFQIIKNIYSQLQDPRRFQIYSRKEAGVYIALAKLGIINNTSNVQIASYYRGAALCYLETNQNDLDAATCLFLAGNYYFDSKKYTEAAINYQDAAALFEKLKNYKKAYELFLKAGDNASKANNLEVAIENYIQAYEVANKDHQKDLRKITGLLVNNLLQMGKIQGAAKNNFVAGTMFLEAAYYYKHIPDSNKSQIIEYVKNAYDQLILSTKEATTIKKQSSIMYTYAILVLIIRILDLKEELPAMLSKLKTNLNKIAHQYYQLVQYLLESMDNNQKVSFDSIDPRFVKIWESSEELRRAYELFWF